MIALGPNARLDAVAIRADLARQWPALPKVEAVKKEETRFSFRIGGQDVVAALMPAPIPWSDLEWPCKTSWLWKDAANVLRSHTNHLIVTVIGEGALLRTRLLTQVTASILATCPQAVGVYWTDAAMVIQPSLFRKFATKILPDGLPLYIWVNFQVGKAASGKAHGFTKGMQAFGHMEFETEDSPEPPGKLRERFFALANYVLDKGAVIQDRDTIGEDADERIRVVHADSAFGQTGKVMRLEYSSVDKPQVPREPAGTFPKSRLLVSSRELFAKARRSLMFFWRPYNRLSRPSWARNTPYECIYREYKQLLKNGSVVWGHLVQANNLLFEPGDYDHPADAVFSLDPFFDSKLRILAGIAGALFDLKGKDVRDLELKEFAEAITDEEEVLFNRRLPRSLTSKRKVYYTTIMVHRKHLPRGYLKASWFPLVVNPRETPASVILPCRYWDPRLVRRWRQAMI